MSENLNLNIIKKIKLLNEDNTIPKIILSYLKLTSKLNNSELEKQVEKYEFFLPKETINETFSNYYFKCYSASELFYLLYDKISSFSTISESDINTKICFYLDLIKKDIDYDLVKGIFEYDQNPELYLILLTNNIKYGIEEQIKDIKDFKIETDNEIITKFNQQIDDINLFIKLEDSNYNKNKGQLEKEKIIIYEKIKKLYKNKKSAMDAINKLNDEINLISKISSKSFVSYFEKFSTFLQVVENNFKKRFTDINKLEKKDFYLFRDFCFFLTHYNFQNLTNFYITKWSNSFQQSDDYIIRLLKKNSHNNINKYTIENNNLILEVYNYKNKQILIKEVKNINKYSISNLIVYLSSLYYKYIIDTCIDTDNEINDDKKNTLLKNKTIINEYLLEPYLKFDSYEEIYFNKIWNKWEIHLLKIFTSPTINTVFEKICKISCKHFVYYNFLNEKDLKQIFKRSAYFQFPSTMLGLTEPYYLFDFEYYKGHNPNLGENCSKLLTLSINQITKEHEILGHINIRLQKYISKMEITSPLSDSENYFNEKSKKKESGDFIEILLYGKSLAELTYNEILFILDFNNYTVNYETFRDNFSKCNSSIYKPSEYLSQFAKDLNIELNKECTKIGYMSLNENLAHKTGSKENKIVYRVGHTHLHRTKKNEDVQKVIDEIYDSILKKKNKK